MKVTVGLAYHWARVTDPLVQRSGQEGGVSTTFTLLLGYGTLYQFVCTNLVSEYTYPGQNAKALIKNAQIPSVNINTTFQVKVVLVPILHSLRVPSCGNGFELMLRTVIGNPVGDFPFLVRTTLENCPGNRKIKKPKYNNIANVWKSCL